MTAQRVSPGGGTSRLRSVVGPEMVAAILVAIVALIGLVAVNAPPGLASLAPSPAPSVIAAVASPSPAPSSSTPTAPPSSSATAGVGGIVATPRPDPTTTPTPAPTPTPIPWASQAGSVLIAGARVIDARESLRTAVEAVPTSADELSRRLRTVNSSLAIAATAARTLDRAGGPFAATSAIRGILDVATTASLQTLKSPLADTPAYVAGGRAVVDTLGALELRLHDLAIAAGLSDPYPFASPSPAP